MHTIGSANQTVGRMSPINLLSTTISDELKLYNNNKSKVIGVALKDRAAILPVGHLANAAYWFYSESGNWVTSSYYMKELPQWMVSLNDRHFA